MRRNNRIFFNFKKDKLITGIIIVQLIFCIFYLYKLSTVLLFKSEYTKLYNSSYPVENGLLIKFSPAQLTGKEVNIEEILKELEKRKIKYGMLLEDLEGKYNIEASSLGIKKEELISRCEYAPMPLVNHISPIKMNFENLDFNKNKLKGSISKENWKVENGIVPVVVGKNFEDKFKIGDKFSHNNIKYKVVGIFNEEVLYSTYYDTVLSAREMSGSFIIPIEKEDFSTNYSKHPIVIFNNSEDEINDALSAYSSDYEIGNFKEDYIWFINEIKYDLTYKIIRTTITTIITIVALIITLMIKLILNKERFGVLYSFGFSKKEIIEIYISEFSFLIYIVLIGSFISVIKFGEFSFRYFLVYNKEIYWIFAVIIVMIFVFISLKFIFNKINKLSPREMMEDFTK